MSNTVEHGGNRYDLDYMSRVELDNLAGLLRAEKERLIADRDRAQEGYFKTGNKMPQSEWNDLNLRILSCTRGIKAVERHIGSKRSKSTRPNNIHY